MANCKDIAIRAEVPFHYLQRDWTERGNEMSDKQARLLAQVLLGPSMGLSYRYRELGYEANENGGQTAMYELTIDGVEALHYEAIRAVVEAIEAGGGRVTLASVTDIEDGIGEEVLIRG